MDYFYSAQLRQYRLQFIRIFSNFQVDVGNDPTNPQLQQVPCTYGDPSAIAQTIVQKNSENTLLTTPFISCVVENITMNPNRRQDPSFVDKVYVNEREYDEQNQRYLQNIGNRYTVERYMAVPYDMEMRVDVWTSNTSIKEQLMEQFLTIFNPSLEIQTSTNPLDWTVITLVELTGINWSNRSLSVNGPNTAPIDVFTLTFKIPIWLNPPAKVKKQQLIEQIIMDLISGEKEKPEQWDWTNYEFFKRLVHTPDDNSIGLTWIGNNQYQLSLESGIGDKEDPLLQPTITYSKPNPIFIVGTTFKFNGINIPITSTDINAVVATGKNALANTAYNIEIYNFNMLKFTNSLGAGNAFANVTGTPVENMGMVETTYPGGNFSWPRLFEAYGNLRPYAQFSTKGSELLLRPSIIDNSNDIKGWIDLYPTDQNQIIWTIDPTTLPATTLPNVNSVIDPNKTAPGAGLPAAQTGQRYLLLGEPPAQTPTWGDLANSRLSDIIQFDGQRWTSVFIAANNLATTEYITNIFNGKLLEWQNGEWSEYIAKNYSAGQWRISL